MVFCFVEISKWFESLISALSVFMYLVLWLEIMAFMVIIYTHVPINTNTHMHILGFFVLQFTVNFVVIQSTERNLINPVLGKKKAYL